MSGMTAMIRRDLLVAFRQVGDLLNPLMFFVMGLSLFPLSVSPDPEFLSKIAPGIIWVVALLATLLSLELMFKSDFEDGSIQQWMLNPTPAWQLIIGKVIAHWIVSGLPLLLLAPLLGVMLYLPDEGYLPLMIGLVIGTPTLSLFGAVGAALTVGLQKGGMLMPVLILPLYMPILILGAGAIQNALLGLPFEGYLAFMLGIFFIALVISPFGAGAALKISVSR